MAKLSEKIGYGLGDFSSSMFWKIFMYYIMFFYTQVFGLTLEDATLLILVTKLWDAVSDPLMGVIADRTSTRWGKYRPYLLWIAIPFAVCGVLTFTTPAFGYAGKVIWAYCTYVLMMTVYTAINVPYGAMLGVMSADSKERNIFSSYRMFFAYAGSFVSLMIFGPLCNLFSSHNNLTSDGNIQLSSEPQAWQMTMIVVGSICAIFFLLSFFLTRERVKVDNKQTENRSSVGRDIKLLVRNAPWWILLGVSLAVVMFNSIRGGVAAYYFADYIGNDSLMGSLFGINIFLTCTIFLTIGEIANMVGVALAVPFAKLVGKKWAYIWSILTVAVFTALFYFIPESGVMSYWLILLLQVVISVAAGVTLPLVWSMFADVADYSEHKNSTSSVGLIFSSSSMAQKFGAAFGSLVIGWLLMSFNYVVPEDAKRYTADEVAQARTEFAAMTAQSYMLEMEHDSGAMITIELTKAENGTITEHISTRQSDTAVDGLKSLISWIPALTALLGALIMMLYPLGESRMAAIQQELNAKRKIDE